MKTIFVTNIPTPYRVSMWNRLNNSLGAKKDTFSVYFMNLTEPGRNWSIEGQFDFPSKQWDMKLFYFMGVPIRFSLSYCLDVIKQSDHIILGASWNDLNVIFIAFLKRFGFIKNKISFWSEANKFTMGASKSSLFKYFLRKWILSSADAAYFIPGEMARITLNEWGVENQDKFVMFPNVPHEIFENNFGAWLGSGADIPVLTIVARLDEKFKGIENFMLAVGKHRLQMINLNIVGSGQDLHNYKNFVAENGLENNVKFLGDLSSDSIVDILIKSDVFVLPSFSDPSPLSIIEALKIGCPLLISKRCGNHYECLEDGGNGFGFMPENQEEIIGAFDNFLANRSKWSEYSKKSLQIANSFHNTDDNLRRLVSWL